MSEPLTVSETTIQREPFPKIESCLPSEPVKMNEPVQ